MNPAASEEKPSERDRMVKTPYFIGGEGRNETGLEDRLQRGKSGARDSGS